MPYKDPERQAKAQREWCARNRAAWLAANGPCKQCGSSEDLQVDHKDPARKVSHRIWSWRPDRRALELAKCQVLCGECHRAKSLLEQRGEKNQAAKLTEADVWGIHRRYAKGESGPSIARSLGICHKQVYRILKGERWAHVHAAVHQKQAA